MAKLIRLVSRLHPSSTVRYGMEGVLGLQTGELLVVEVGDLGLKDAGRSRVKQPTRWVAAHVETVVVTTGSGCPPS